MISAIFSVQPLLLVLLVTSCAALATTGFLLGCRFNKPKRFFWALTGLGLGLALSATLTPAKDSAGYSGTCTISKDVLQSVSTEQWLLNFALLVPVSLFFILAGTPYISAVAGAATLSMAIEITQATFPGIGRACDSDDFIANTLGALAVALFLAVTSSLKGGFRDKRFGVGRSGLLVHGAVMTVVAVAGFSRLTMNYVDSSTPIREASASQEKVASRALEALSGHRFKVTRAQISNLPSAYEAGQQTLIASWNGGNAELSWPGAKIHTIWSSEGVRLQGYEGQSTVDNKSAAMALAAKFVTKNFPWVTAATNISAAPDPEFRGAWRVTYQKKRDGVTMPLHFSVTFARDGRLMQLTAKNTPAS